MVDQTQMVSLETCPPAGSAAAPLSLTIRDSRAWPLPGRHLDLHGIRFVDPFGLVLIACAAHALSGGGERFYRLPDEPSVASYCTRIGLVDALAAAASLEPVDGRPTIDINDRSDVLSEVRRVDTANGRTPAVAGLVYQRLSRWPELAEAAFCCVAEAANNVGDHARSIGYAAAQVFRRGFPDERIVLAIGDPGCGMAASLRPRHGAMSDSEALRIVLEEGASGTRDQGTGIASMIDVVDDLGGTLILLSGTATARRSEKRSSITESVEISGTAVGIELPCGGQGR